MRPPDTYGSGPGVPKRLLDAFGPLGDDDKPAEQAPTAEANGWQPIETAPRDGTTVILLCSKFAGEVSGVHAALDYQRAVEVGNFINGRSDYPGDNWWNLGGDVYACWGWPTHWQPLPAPPEGR